MTHTPAIQRAVTLERVVYGMLLKTAVRLGGAFRKATSGQQIVVVAVLRDGAAFDEFVAAAGLLVEEVEALGGFVVAAPKVSVRTGVDCSPILSRAKQGQSLLVVWPPGHDVPRDVSLLADRVVSVGTVRDHHLVAAAKQLAGQSLDPADAKKMMEYPLRDVFAAFRKSRPPYDVLSRLAEVERDTHVKAEGPRLEDLVGYGDAKTWGLSLARDIASWKQGDLAWSDVDRGLLLSGPPGTGKTMFAGALARSCHAHLVATSVARWQAAGRLDDTLKAMRRSFEEAIVRKPSILFVDEFDGIGDRNRLIGTEHETYWAQIINFLLELIDGHERLDGVVVIGATNHPQAIDPALCRPGRLDRHIRISLPDLEERKHLARMYFGQQLSEADAIEIAAATAGFTGAQFEGAGRQARRTARETGREVDLDIAMGGLPRARTLDAKSRKAVALHEAGHAVVGVCLGVGELRAVLLPRETRAGQPVGFAQFIYPQGTEADRSSLSDRIALFLSGRAAEEEFLGTAYEGAGGVEGSDLSLATEIAVSMELGLGMGEGLAFIGVADSKERTRLLSTSPRLATRVERRLTTEMRRCRDIVKGNRTAILAVAGILEDKGHIDGNEVTGIVEKQKASSGPRRAEK